MRRIRALVAVPDQKPLLQHTGMLPLLQQDGRQIGSLITLAAWNNSVWRLPSVSPVTRFCSKIRYAPELRKAAASHIRPCRLSLLLHC